MVRIPISSLLSSSDSVNPSRLVSVSQATCNYRANRSPPILIPHFLEGLDLTPREKVAQEIRNLPPFGKNYYQGQNLKNLS
jgi:hypothetical protein